MAQYLDLNGLRTVVENVKNIKSPVCLPIYNGSVVLSTVNSTIKNDTAPSYTSIVYNSGSRCFLARYNNSTTYYTKWKADNTHMSSDNYGTATTSGVSPKAGYLYANSYNSTLQMSFANSRLTNVANYVTPSAWKTVTIANSPFVDVDGYITKVEYRESENGTYIWRITMTNKDGEAQQWDVYQSNVYIQYGIYLDDGASGCFTMELPKSTQKGTFGIHY